MNQLEFIHNHIDQHVEKFNTKLFTRSDDAIIDQLQKIILSCQSDGFFKIKVKSFEVVDDYDKIVDMLQNFYENSQKKGKNKLDEDNRYNFIDLKSSDIRLLLVNYHIAIKDESGDAQVMIAIPKVVNKFYFYLNGNYYSSMYQIVDASTYNNSASKSKSRSVTLKTNIQPTRIYRHTNKLVTSEGKEVKATEYDCNVFKKTVPTFLYMLAKFGLNGALSFFGVSAAVFVTDKKDQFAGDSLLYTFVPKKNPKLGVVIPKDIYDNNSVVQHIAYTICTYIDSDATLMDLYNREYWISKLGMSFNSANRLAKGYNVLSSIESILDINIQEQLRLPEDQKRTIYDILRWIIREYAALRLKDNLDVLTKKVRCAEYIAAMYATKLTTSLYRLSNNGNRSDLKTIKRNIYIQPMYLINQITKSQLITFRNTVTDMDSVIPLKFTYKGISGIGEGKNSSIPDQFRLLDISNMGILDPDSSSPSDPGVSGSLVPMLHLYDYGYLSNRKEPMTWETEYEELYNAYKKARGLVEVLEFKKDVLDHHVSEDELETAKTSERTIGNINVTMAKEMAKDPDGESVQGLPLEGSGNIYYE